MNRRTHIKSIAGLAGALLTGAASKTFSAVSENASVVSQGKIITVTGEIEPSELGLTLPHEHIFSTLGRVPARYPSYPEQELMETVIPYLKKLRELGVKTIADSTTAFTGRHPEYLKRISEETGIQILTNTGYFGAEKGVYIPDRLKNKTSDEIAERWIAEVNNGIDETGIYPGFIKTAVEHKPLIEVDRKLIEAAAKTHKETGLAIQTHIGNNIAGGNEVLDILTDNNIDPEAWVWVHAQQIPIAEDLIAPAKMGAYISFDRLNKETAEHYLAVMKLFKTEGLLHKFLLSHSGNVYSGDIEDRENYHFLVTDFKARFLAYGFPESDFKLITEKNPAELFTVNKRLL